MTDKYCPCSICNGFGWHSVEVFDHQSKCWIPGDEQEDCFACNGTGKQPLTPILKAIDEQFSLNYLGNRDIDFDDCGGALAFNDESAWFSGDGYELHPSDSSQSFCIVRTEDVWEVGFTGDGDRAIETVKNIISKGDRADKQISLN